jgi:branched-chain amino acid transport system permease protein
MVGALLGGLVIGVSEALAGLLIAPSAKGMVSFGLLVVILLVRPQGLLGANRR